MPLRLRWHGRPARENQEHDAYTTAQWVLNLVVMSCQFMRKVFPAMSTNLGRPAFLIAIVIILGTWFQSADVHGQIPVPTDPADTRIPRNSKVYLAPMDGFEQYLAAALRKKSVPLLIVTDRADADFEITGTHEKKDAGWARIIFSRSSLPSASASIQVVNLRTRVVVFADSSHRTYALRGERSTAEKLAKYLKRRMNKDAKKSRDNSTQP